MNMSKLLKSRKGTTFVFFAIVLVVIIAFTSLSVDVGVIVFEKAKLSNTVDAAALAGAQELVTNALNTKNVVNEYISKNNIGLKETTITVSESERYVRVTSSKNVKTYFANVFGNSSKDVTSTAKAQVENISALSGCRPIAVIKQTFIYGNIYVLKEGAGDGFSGNYAAISLGGNGGAVYENNLLNGYSGTIRVGDTIPTETGVIAKKTSNSIATLISRCDHTPPCTYTYYNKNCSRIIFIPVVDTLYVNGKKHIKVLGFATFFLEGAVNSGGQTDIIGRFITYHADGETSPDINDYGTYGIKLVK
jgi:Flp pilus assembly protein TadG